MAKIEIYTSPFCGYCHRAKRFLHAKGVEFIQYNVMMNSGKRQEMQARSNGATTVPQIFINDEHLGDSDFLSVLEARGELDAKLELA